MIMISMKSSFEQDTKRNKIIFTQFPDRRLSYVVIDLILKTNTIVNQSYLVLSAFSYVKFEF